MEKSATINPSYIVDSFNDKDLLPNISYTVWYLDDKLLYHDHGIARFRDWFVNEDIDDETIIKALTPVYKAKAELDPTYADFLLTTDTSEPCLIKPYYQYYIKNINKPLGKTVEERIANALMADADFVLYYKNDELYYYFLYKNCIYYCSAKENPERLAQKL